MIAISSRSTRLAALAWVAIASPLTAGPLQIDTLEFDADTGEFRFQVTSVPGELLIDRGTDAQSWTPLFPLSSTGTPFQFVDATASGTMLYRVALCPDTDDLHLNGGLAQELRTAVPYPDLQAVFGLGAGPPAQPVTLVRELPTATSGQRSYAAAIAILSLLGQDLLDTLVPQPSAAEVAAALAADLASGALDGRDSGGARISIGAGGPLLPEYRDQHLLDTIAGLNENLSGLKNVVFSVNAGQLGTTFPADWNTFYWDSSDWQ